MKERTSIFRDEIESYIDSEFVKRPTEFFLEMEAYAREKNIPIISPATGAVLSSLASLWKPEKIWELGTGIGYSTLWMALGSHESKITTLDRNELQASLLDEYAEKILKGKPNNIRRVVSWILDYMHENVTEWSDADLFFIDCDKVAYPELWDLITHHAKPGARIVYDNVLWHGRIMKPEFQNPSDVAVRALWKRVKTSNFPYTLFPVGDGLLIAEKP